MTDGAFTPSGRFVTLPAVDDEPFATLFREKVFALLRRKGRIDDRIIRQMRGWRHSGFSVDRSVRLRSGDGRGLERLARYLVRCPFSLSRMIRVTQEGKVLYRAEKSECRRFPGGGGVGHARDADELFGGVRRNFQVFEPLDFLAELTQHVPDRWEHLVRYYGWYSNKSRGLRAKRRGHGGHAPVELAVTPADEPPTADQAQRRRRWAQLIQRVFEVDPLTCVRCGGRMKVVGFIEPCQPEVIDRILHHLGLDRQPRPPPDDGPSAEVEVEVEGEACESGSGPAAAYPEDWDPGF